MEERTSPSFGAQARGVLVASRPRRAVATAIGLALAAAIGGRPLREAGLVLVTVLVGQAVLGLDNDVVDRRRDHRLDRRDKPIARGDLDPGNAWFAIACGLLLVVPLSVAHGLAAAVAYLGSLALGFLANRFLRRTPASFVPWAGAFALYPVFLAYGGWGGVGADGPPDPAAVALFALLGIGIHVLAALDGLVDDRADHFRSLPLLLALRIGAPRLRVLAVGWSALLGVAILMTGLGPGLGS